jgi:multidrug efflux pump
MFAEFFVDRPVLSTVLSLVIVIIGLVALPTLPIAQYPEITPPTIAITAVYPGASAQVVADTVAAPIEQEVNGIENMLYLRSRSTNDGQLAIDVTFKVGTNIDQAQVLTQNRVSIAEAKLPEEVRRQGVTVKKKSPNILLAINLISPAGKYDQLWMSNYATTQLKDSLARIAGVGDVSFLGARDYSMRIWLDPNQLAARSLTAADVLASLREQNIQVAAGRLGQQPAPAGQAQELIINTQGRLLEPEQFADVIVKSGTDGQIVRVRDLARTELGAKNYDMNTYLDGQPCTMLAIFQLPGSNALDTAAKVKAEIARLGERFPQGLEYRIVYDTTVFVDESIREVYKTLFEAFLLVFLVVLLFLQDWRATLMPMIDVPVSLIGTFAIMSLLGFSLNNLSLFGLVLAIGIVVDDAIVVVENIERWLHHGLPIREATIKAMAEITGPVIAITLVLCSVFIPTAFISGISGEFYRQFALTIASATCISAVNAMTMAPSRAAQIFKPKAGHDGDHKEALPQWMHAVVGAYVAYEFVLPWFVGGHGAHASWLQIAIACGIGAVVCWFAAPWLNRGLNVFFRGFNWVFDRLSAGYGHGVKRLVRFSLMMVLLYGGLIWLTFHAFQTVPVGFIPEQDKGYLVAFVQLPDGASLERTDAFMREVDKVVSETDGVANTVMMVGYNVVHSVNLSNAGGMFVILDPFEERIGDPQLSGPAITRALRQKLGQFVEGQALVFGPPPVDGLSSTGGFKLYVQDREGEGSTALQSAVDALSQAANAQPGIVGSFSGFQANQPQVFVDVDRTKVRAKNLSIDAVNQTLQVYLGSAYANDFTRFGRNWQVNVQADAQYRLSPEDIGRLQVRNDLGAMVPLSAVLSASDTSGPAVVFRYNMYPAADVSGNPRPGVSSGEIISVMEQLSKSELPASMGMEWTELTLLQILAGNTAMLVFGLGTVLVFLVLAAQYESWSMPLAVILIVPMCLLAALGGVWLTKSDNNIFTQIGFVVLIALAAKNAILIVEFAKQREREGASRRDAVVEACQVRLRPILMTSFAFILGVVPLVLGKGAGAEMRNALGIAVFSGMLGVTVFGLIFTPVFYEVVQRLFPPPPAPTVPAPSADKAH